MHSWEHSEEILLVSLSSCFLFMKSFLPSEFFHLMPFAIEGSVHVGDSS